MKKSSLDSRFSYDFLNVCLPLSIYSALSSEFPTTKDFGLEKEPFMGKIYEGGERMALRQLDVRLARETKAFKAGSFLPNQRDPDILCPPTSLGRREKTPDVDQVPGCFAGSAVVVESLIVSKMA